MPLEGFEPQFYPLEHCANPCNPSKLGHFGSSSADSDVIELWPSVAKLWPDLTSLVRGPLCAVPSLPSNLERSGPQARNTTIMGRVLVFVARGCELRPLDSHDFNNPESFEFTRTNSVLCRLCPKCVHHARRRLPSSADVSVHLRRASFSAVQRTLGHASVAFTPDVCSDLFATMTMSTRLHPSSMRPDGRRLWPKRCQTIQKRKKTLLDPSK